MRQLDGPPFQQDLPAGLKVVPGQRDLFVAGEVLDGHVNVLAAAGGDEVELDSVKVVPARRQVADGALDSLVLGGDEVKLGHGSLEGHNSEYPFVDGGPWFCVCPARDRRMRVNEPARPGWRAGGSESRAAVGDGH